MSTQDIPYSTVPPPPPPPTPPPIPLPNLLLIGILAIVLTPSFALLRLVGLASPTDSFSHYITTTFNGPNLVESQYRLLFTVQASAQRRLYAARAATASLLATILLPSLRSSSLLHSPLYKWALLAVNVFRSRYSLDYVVANAVARLEPRNRRNKRWTYYTNDYVRDPLGSALQSIFILVTWWALQLSSELHPVTRYGAWVCGAWVLRCSLVFLHSGVLARWKANAIYDRYEEKILRIGFQFHIMYALLPSVGFDGSPLAPWRKKEGEMEIVQLASDWSSHVGVCYTVEDHILHVSKHQITTQEVALIAMYALGLTTLLPPELGVDLPSTVRLELGIAPDDGGQIDKTWIKDKFKLSEEDARILYGELCALVSSPDQVSFHTFSTWMIGAYSYNMEIAQMLREEDNAILNSDRLLMALLMNKAFLLWLFLTGKTITKVLSVIPFVYFAKCFIDEMLLPQFQMLIR